MEFTDLLTIAIPCYERKEYFLDALNSALNQTIKCEIIVVDNCSSHDYFEQVCNEKKIKYYRNETNIGLFPNQNRCYSLAETEYVKILDDDDMLMPEYVESFLRAIELHPDIDVYFSDYNLFTTGKEYAHSEILPFGYMDGDRVDEFGIKYRLAFPYMTSTVRKTKAKLELDNIDCVGGYDYVWVYSNTDELSFYGDPIKLHKYRIHNGKASHMDRDLIANVLTASYIYDNILRPKISDGKLKSKISKNIFWRFIFLQSFGNKAELNNLINSENRFGKYFKEKLQENFYLRVLLSLPQLVVSVIYRILIKIGFTK